jgi:hypothetical protein
MIALFVSGRVPKDKAVSYGKKEIPKKPIEAE